MHLVIFGTSNILSDIVECALSNNLLPTRIILNLPEICGKRDLLLDQRIEQWAKFFPTPTLEPFEKFSPKEGEKYILGPTTPQREVLATKILEKFSLQFCSLIHPSAHLSKMATIGDGVFVGAGSIIGPGALLENHVFINRGVTIGHDTKIGSFSRIQPGCNIGGLSVLGRANSIGIGTTISDRIVIGDRTIVGGGSVVLNDLPSDVMAAGVPATIKRNL